MQEEKKKKLSRPRRLLGDIVLSLKPPYSFFFFKCRRFIILNDVLVMRASMGLEDSTEARGIGSSQRQRCSQLRATRYGCWVPGIQVPTRAVCGRNTAHLSSPTSPVRNTKVFLRLPVSLKSWHLTILFTLCERHFFLQLFSLFQTCRVLVLKVNPLPLLLWLLQMPLSGL